MRRVAGAPFPITLLIDIAAVPGATAVDVVLSLIVSLPVAIGIVIVILARHRIIQLIPHTPPQPVYVRAVVICISAIPRPDRASILVGPSPTSMVVCLHLVVTILAIAIAVPELIRVSMVRVDRLPALFPRVFARSPVTSMGISMMSVVVISTQMRIVVRVQIVLARPAQAGREVA